MTEAVKFPSARQDVFYPDPQTGRPVFTRPWFLFFQSIWQRQGGAVAPDTPDLEASLFEDAGNSESFAAIFRLQQDISQAPPIVQLIEQQATLEAQISEQRDQIAELVKTINDMRQSPATNI